MRGIGFRFQVSGVSKGDTQTADILIEQLWTSSLIDAVISL